MYVYAILISFFSHINFSLVPFLVDDKISYLIFFKLNAYYENKYFDENYQENNITNRHCLRSHVEVILSFCISTIHKQSSLHYQLFHYLAIIRTLTISNGNILKLNAS